MTTTSDDNRAKFVVAQQLLDEGRLTEARWLLRSIEDVPQAQEWADRLERGETVPPTDLQELADTYYPDDDSVEMPSFQPMRFMMSVFLALMLLTPILQMFMMSGAAVYPSQNAALRGEARERVQLLCNTLVGQAIQERRLREPFGSCFDWSLSLTDDQMRSVIRCHARTANDSAAFRRCVLDADIIPPELIPSADSV